MGAWSRVTPFFAANVLFASGLFFHSLLYNFYLENLGSSPAVMGRAAAALTLGGLLALLPAGALVDRLGPRAVVLAAAGTAALGLAAGAAATGTVAIYLAALVAGAGTSGWRVASAPILMALTDSGVRARAFSWNVGLLVGTGGAWLALAGAAPAWLQGAFVMDRATAVRASLLAGALLTLTSVPMFLLARVPSRTPRSADAAGPAVARADARPTDAAGSFGLATPALIGLVVLVGLWMTAPALVQSFFNIYFARVHGLSVERIGLIFGLSHGVTALLIFGSGEMAARFGPRRALTAWLILFAPVMWAFITVRSVAVAVGLYLVQGMVSPATNPLIDQILLERVPAERRGLVSSWRNVATEGAGIVGSTAGGSVLGATSFGGLFGAAGGLALVGGGLLIAGLRSLRSRY